MEGKWSIGGVGIAIEALKLALKKECVCRKTYVHVNM